MALGRGDERYLHYGSLRCGASGISPPPLFLGFDCSKEWKTPRPSVEKLRKKPFASLTLDAMQC